MLNENELKKLEKDGWERVPDPDNESWNPQVIGDEVTGTYLNMDTNVGRNHSNLYIIQKENGELIGVFGTVILDKKMKTVPTGWEVKIIFEGTKASKPPKKPLKLFQVFKRPGDEEEPKDQKTQFKMNPHDDPEARQNIDEITETLIKENRPPSTDKEILERAKKMHIEDKESMPKSMLKRIEEQLNRRN